MTEAFSQRTFQIGSYESHRKIVIDKFVEIQLGGEWLAVK
jgi:hypothetical protein